MCSILCKRVARVKIFCGAGSKLKKPNPLPLTSLQHIYSNPKLEMVIKRLNIQIMRGCKNQRTNLSNVCWPVMTNSVGWQTQLQNNLIMCTVKLCTWVNLNCLFDDKIWLSGNFSGKIIWLASLLQRGFFSIHLCWELELRSVFLFLPFIRIIIIVITMTNFTTKFILFSEHDQSWWLSGSCGRHLVCQSGA